MAGERLEKALGRHRKRYRAADRGEGSEVLDEFCRLTGYHSKYAIALLRRWDDGPVAKPRRRRGPTYSAEAVRVLERIWQATDYPWSERRSVWFPFRRNVPGW